LEHLNLHSKMMMQAAVSFEVLVPVYQFTSQNTDVFKSYIPKEKKPQNSNY
jgi:hypothetical protein